MLARCRQQKMLRQSVRSAERSMGFWGAMYLFHVRYDDPNHYRCNEHDAKHQNIEFHGSLPFLLFQDGNNEDLLPACLAWFCIAVIGEPTVRCTSQTLGYYPNTCLLIFLLLRFLTEKFRQQLYFWLVAVQLPKNHIPFDQICPTWNGGKRSRRSVSASSRQTRKCVLSMKKWRRESISNSTV